MSFVFLSRNKIYFIFALSCVKVCLSSDWYGILGTHSHSHASQPSQPPPSCTTLLSVSSYNRVATLDVGLSLSKLLVKV